MSRMKRLGVIAASIVVSASAVVGLGAGPAAASCAPDVVVGVTGSQSVFMWDGKTWFKDGPGGTVTGTVQVTRTVSATISAGANITVNDLVSSVQLQVSASATNSVTTTLGHQYTHSIPANKFGNLKYGSWGYHVSWVEEYRHSNCTITVVQRGTGTVPTVATGWYYYTS